MKAHDKAPSRPSFPRFGAKDFTTWTMHAYHLAQPPVAKIDARVCLPLVRNIPRLVRGALEHLDHIERLYPDYSHPVQTAATPARLYMAGLYFAHTQCCAAETLPRDRDALLARATTMRAYFRSEEADMVAHKIVSDEYVPVRTRANHPHDVARELLELVKRGHLYRGFANEDKLDTTLRMFEAQVVGERLLAQLGERDAAGFEHVALRERAYLYTLAVENWAALRGALKRELADEARVNALAPAIYVGDA